MNKRNSKLFLSVTLFALFILIAYCVKTGILLPKFDEKISGFFSERQSAYGIQVMQVFSFLGSGYFLPAFIVLINAWFFLRKEKREGIFLFLTFVVGAVIGELFKASFGRIRPINVFESGVSFPSIHSLSAILVYGGIAYLLWNRNRKIAYVAIVLPLIIGFSRIYLNVHWLSDVLAGFVLGLGVLLLGAWFFEKSLSRSCQSNL